MLALEEIKWAFGLMDKNTRNKYGRNQKNVRNNNNNENLASPSSSSYVSTVDGFSMFF